MRYIMLALFVVGCGSTLPPTEGTTEWSVTLGSWETPTCKGSMTLAAHPSKDFTGQTDFVGSWSCGSYGKGAAGQLTADGRVFLNLETTSGFWNGVRGTMPDGDAMAGDILLDDVLTPFAAYRQ